MDFRTATRIAESLEKEHAEISVAGIEEVRREGKRPGWAIDVVHRRTGRMVTLDDQDYWPRLLELLDSVGEKDAELDKPNLRRSA